MIIYPYDDEDWTQSVYPTDTPTSAFKELEPIAELWHGKRVNGRFPAWSDFEKADFQEWYEWICVYDIVGKDPFDFRPLLWGKEITGLLGYDLKGMSPRTNSTKPYKYTAWHYQEDMDFLFDLQQLGAIGVTVGSIFWGFRKHVRVKDIYLPLATDGETVDMFLTATCTL